VRECKSEDEPDHSRSIGRFFTDKEGLLFDNPVTSIHPPSHILTLR